MKKMGRIKLVALFLGIGVLAALSWHLAQAAGKTPSCDKDGQCEWTEVKASGLQSCQDCYPKSYAPLNILPFPQVIAGGTYDYSYSNNKIFQFVGSDTNGDGIGEYSDVWASAVLEPNTRAVCLADVDNDGQREVVAATSLFAYKTGGKNGTSYYSTVINLFEAGSTGMPTWTSPASDTSPGGISDIETGDVDGDGRTEVVVLKGRHISIYEIGFSEDGYTFVQEYPGTFPDYPWIIFSIHIGDADNCGHNEIVLAMFEVGAPIIWKYDTVALSWSSQTAELVPSQYWNPRLPTPWIAIDTARVRDADDIPGNEIISGGNSNRLIIWKHNPSSGTYDLVFISEDLGGFTQGVDAGDIDGDGQNEIVVGDQGNSPPPQLHVFKYLSGGYIKTHSEDNIEVGFIRVGDVDQDGRAEVVTQGQGMKIFEWSNNQFIQSFACVWGQGGEIR